MLFSPPIIFRSTIKLSRTIIGKEKISLTSGMIVLLLRKGFVKIVAQNNAGLGVFACTMDYLSAESV